MWFQFFFYNLEYILVWKLFGESLFICDVKNSFLQ